jgi:hypothetical protein
LTSTLNLKIKTDRKSNINMKEEVHMWIYHGALKEGITQEGNSSNSSNVMFVKFLNNVNVSHKLLKTSQTPMNKLHVFHLL